MTSNSKFIGYLVSIESKNTFYQGIINLIDPNKAIVQLKSCFQNGLNLGNKLIEIKTNEIDNIEILADPLNALNLLKPSSLTESNGTINNNNNKQDDINLSLNQNDNTHSNNNGTNSSKSTSKQISPNNNNFGDTFNYNHHNNYNNNNNNNSNNYQHYNHTNNNHNQNLKRNNSSYYNGYNNNNNNFNNEENCFNSLNDDSLKDDFDFEKNLALFDKNAFYEEIEGHTKPSSKAQNQTFSSESSVSSKAGSNHEQQYLTAPLPPPPQQQQSQTLYHPISLDNLFSSVVKQQQQQQLQQQHSKQEEPKQEQKQNHSNNVFINGSSSKNYRFDEMILNTGEPINFKQIQLPYRYTNKNYVTDDGFVIPCIDFKMRELLFEQSYRFGFNKQRQIECMGRCCTEMCLQLLGGSIRFLPKNNHQKPSILILANNNSIQGIYALCAARLLSIRTVKIYLFVLKPSQEENEEFNNELNLFKSNYDSTSTCIINNISELNNIKSVDLIMNGLESFLDSSSLLTNKSKNQLILTNLKKYIDQCKASVLSIDPPSIKENIVIPSKWCITPILPMEMSNNSGRVYLCDFGFTRQIFQSVNIKYQSPFGAKFVIPLHDD